MSGQHSRKMGKSESLLEGSSPREPPDFTGDRLKRKLSHGNPRVPGLFSYQNPAYHILTQSTFPSTKI